MSASVIILLIFSYIFYALLDARSLPILIAMSLFTYLGGLAIKRRKGKDNKALAVFIIATQVAVLCFFKYSGVWHLPVGMSFYMLMAISFITDVYRGDLDKFPTLAEVLLYVSFFPTVISGPIMKAKELIPQFKDRKKMSKDRLEAGVWMIAFGAALKLIMADRLASAVDCVYSTPLVYSGLTLFVTSIGYTLQLLFDFAGYSYMSVGVAKILGFEITKNFDLPYIATSPSDFWRRWHISLSSYLKDYVYIPLGGNRKGKVRTYINIFLVMTVSGLWHGSTLNFLVWGMLHGLGQVVVRAMKNLTQKETGNISAGFLSRLFTFLFVSFLWIPFRAETLSDSWTIFKRIITFAEGASYYFVYIFIFAVVLLAVEIYAIIRNNGHDPLKALPLSKMYARVLFCMLVIVTAMFAYFGNGAFIYAKF